MKDTWILAASLFLMLAVMLTGRYLRGDFTTIEYIHTPSVADAENLVVEQNGRALININATDAETLDLLEGIGPTLSERIVAYREEYGNFASLDELIKVDGIGTKTLERIRSRLICLP